MTHLTEYAAVPSDPVWEETKGALERGRYRIERAMGPDRRWVLRILRPGALEAEEAPTGPHSSMTGAKAWARHYDIVNVRRLKLFRHGLLALVILGAALAVYDVALSADSSVALWGVIIGLVLLQFGLRELVWFVSIMGTAASDDELFGSMTLVDRTVARVVRSMRRPVDAAPETGDQVWIVEDWDDDAQA